VNHRRTLAVLCAAALLAAACSDGADDGAADEEFGDPGDCTVADLSVSPEKLDLLTELAQDFNDSDAARTGDGCVFARVQSKSSGGASQLLATGWDEETEGPRPVIWSPAASTWGTVLNQRLAAGGEPPMAADFTSFQLTPLVIAMPRPMAEALGWPDE